MKILILPKGANPYQELLYSELRRSHPKDTFSYLETNRIKFLFYPLIFIVKRLQGYKVIHIHWLVFSITTPLPFSKLLSYYYSLLCLNVLKIMGYKIIWTVHDITPHEEETINDIAISKKLSRIAAAKIVHTKSTIIQMRQLGIDTENVSIIPHGNYSSSYPDKISQTQARSKLNIKQKEVVILFFGLIRAYKGIDNLLNSYAKISTKNTRLIIAGKSMDESIRRKIIIAKKNTPIDYYDGYVSDDEVATYFSACDVVCLPFAAITTSGSVFLALTFGKPIIAPRTGALRDLPNNVGYLYDPKEPKILEEKLTLAIEDKLKLKLLGKNAKVYSYNFSWDIIAYKTYSLYKKVQTRNFNN